MNATGSQNPSPKEAPVIRKTEPTGPGAIAGYAFTCPSCGLELKNSMLTGLEIDMLIHGRWPAGTDRGCLAPIPGPEGSAR